jgi:hypothetical protein
MSKWLWGLSRYHTPHDVDAFVLRYLQVLHLRLRSSPPLKRQPSHTLPILPARHRKSLPTHVAGKKALVPHVSGRNGAHAVRSTRTVAQQSTIVQKAVSRALAFAMPNLPRASHLLLLALRYYPHRVSRHRSPLHGQLVPQDPPFLS